MSRRTLSAAVVVCLAAVLLALVPVGTAVSQELMDVFVTNWPDIQKIRGTVSVEGPIRNANLVRMKDIIVNPVRRTETTRLIDAGTLVTDGYSHLVLSLTGQVKGEVVKVGEVGAILLPEEETILQAFHEEGKLLFALEVASTDVSRTSAYFSSEQTRLPLAFPRYKVLLYNTSDKTVDAEVFAYLTN